ncbi:hypothetical protein BJ170DRAFT_277008 [Xylariales sp. AK1849]|nr:hypothetical protein BJ170DRAFT_277008 [Xylariales sp. AK1849]
MPSSLRIHASPPCSPLYTSLPDKHRLQTNPQFCQGGFNFSGPCVITQELHKANSIPWHGVNTAEDIATTLKTFFLVITDDVVQQTLDNYPGADYASLGLRIDDMKKQFDLTVHIHAITDALGNNPWNALVALGGVMQETDQGYYYKYTFLESSC